ncbi:MAG: aldehyde dehydrogenase [Bacteroidaceae bacterium]|nr:aldehyde dehydrogenase [Bacteroidaceae bacterium]MBQ1200270.1 aldehyde dehydrogenase [Bacteroidaceae bacterium]
MKTMENTPREEIRRIVEAQREFFRSGRTLDLEFRRENLRALERALHKWEGRLADALWQDLHKSYEEAYLTELSIVLGEVKNHIAHLGRWAAPRRVCTPLKMFPSWSKVILEPLGCSLIIAPWNYPVQLLLNPLVGAISAGCTAVLKPSPYVPRVSRVMEEMIRETFATEYVAVVQGNREVNTALLEERYNMIFFTGSPSLGRRVMRAASEHLTPVVLELGGKSPCIVDRDADIPMAARRIAWGKSLNAGQTCIAPDYLLVHAGVKERLIEALGREFEHLLGKNPQEAKHFVRIVSDKAFDRLTGYLKDGNVRIGGTYDREERYIHPTVLDGVREDSPIMQEEIFGPLFPLLTFNTTDEAIAFVNRREKPLALYYFGEDRGNIGKVLRHTSSGGACINDTIMHIANENLPFGGVGHSGMSSYHGRESFLVFSHQRAVVTTPTWLDLPFRYMPYRFFGMVKRML